MLKQMNSGLNAFQVQKGKLDVQFKQVQQPIMLARPFLLLGFGALLVTAALHINVILTLAAAVIVLALAGMLKRQFNRWLQHFDQLDSMILVTRSGLLRAVKVRDLVEGDLIQLQAGAILPVDGRVLSGDLKQTAWLQLLEKLSDKVLANGIALAGSKAQSQAQVEVLAVGSRRFVAGAADDLAAIDNLSLKQVFGSWLLAVLSISRRFAASAYQTLVIFSQAAKKSVQQIQHAARLLAEFLVNKSLVGYIRHQSVEAAFRYNQNPVSSPLPAR